MHRGLGVDLVRKGLPARLLDFLHLLLEGTDHQEEAEPKNPAGYSEEYVRNGWALGDAKENIEDAEEKVGSSPNDPRQQEPFILLKHKDLRVVKNMFTFVT